MGMMENFLFILLAEAHGAEEGGFGLNLDIWEANFINLAILGWVVFSLGRKFFGKTLNDRSSKIAEAISEAEKRQKDAAEALADQQQKLAQAQAQAERIRQEAQERAKTAKAAIAAKTEQDIQRLKEVAVQDLNSEQERAMFELRQRVVALAMEQVESQLRDRLDGAAQTQLIDQSIAQLGGSR